MAPFAVKHEHSAETCPLGDKEMPSMLLQLLSPPNASKFGVDIHASAVLDAGDSAKLQECMAPFSQTGTVEITAANSCETVVERGRC